MTPLGGFARKRYPRAMNAVAARRSGAPSMSNRASSLVLAALATGGPLVLLILGLSIQTVQQLRERQMSVDLIPLPPTPPPQEQPKPAPAKPAERAAAPAPAAPRPASLVDQSTPIVPQPAPQPPAADVSGTGTSTSPGTGAGGNGLGGNGTGPGMGGAAPSPPLRTAASWIYKPDSEDLRPYNPPRADADDVTGEVILSCRVLRTRKVTDCRVASERPRGYGFGRAALQASGMFRLRPPTINGEPDEKQRVEIPVTFNNRRP